MSRYILNPLTADHSAVVGWDRMLNTFFVHVLDTSKDEDDEQYTVLCEPTPPNHITDPQEIIELVRPYAVLNTAIVDKLMMTLTDDMNGT